MTFFQTKKFDSDTMEFEELQELTESMLKQILPNMQLKELSTKSVMIATCIENDSEPKNFSDLNRLLSTSGNQQQQYRTLPLLMLCQGVGPREPVGGYTFTFTYEPSKLGFNMYKNLEKVTIEAKPVTTTAEEKHENSDLTYVNNATLFALALHVLQEMCNTRLCELQIMLQSMKKPLDECPTVELQTKFQNVYDELVTKLKTYNENLSLFLQNVSNLMSIKESNEYQVTQQILNLQNLLDELNNNGRYHFSVLKSALDIAVKEFSLAERNASKFKKNWYKCVAAKMASFKTTGFYKPTPENWIRFFYENIVCCSMSNQLCSSYTEFYDRGFQLVLKSLEETRVERDKEYFVRIGEWLPGPCIAYKNTYQRLIDPQSPPDLTLNEHECTSTLVSQAVALMDGLSKLLYVVRYSAEPNDPVKSRFRVVFPTWEELLCYVTAHLQHYEHNLPPAPKRRFQEPLSPKTSSWREKLLQPFANALSALKTLVTRNPKRTIVLATVMMGSYGFYHRAVVGSTIKGLFVSLMDTVTYLFVIKSCVEVTQQASNASTSVVLAGFENQTRFLTSFQRFLWLFGAYNPPGIVEDTLAAAVRQNRTQEDFAMIYRAINNSNSDFRRVVSVLDPKALLQVMATERKDVSWILNVMEMQDLVAKFIGTYVYEESQGFTTVFRAVVGFIIALVLLYLAKWGYNKMSQKWNNRKNRVAAQPAALPGAPLQPLPAPPGAPEEKL